VGNNIKSQFSSESIFLIRNVSQHFLLKIVWAFFFPVKSTERCVYMMAQHGCITKWGNYAAQSLGLLSVLMGSTQRQQQGYGVSLNYLLLGDGQGRMR
jgi:hypothetical protein